MSKARLVITAVIEEGRPVAEVARAYGVHRAWVYRLVARYRGEGEAAFKPRSRRPHTYPTALPAAVVQPQAAVERLLGPRRNHVMSADPIQSQGIRGAMGAMRKRITMPTE